MRTLQFRLLHEQVALVDSVIRSTIPRRCRFFILHGAASAEQLEALSRALRDSFGYQSTSSLIEQ